MHIVGIGKSSWMRRVLNYVPSIPHGVGFAIPDYLSESKPQAIFFINEMNRILAGLKGVNVIRDDILVYGKNIKEQNERLLAVLERARESNLKNQKYVSNR